MTKRTKTKAAQAASRVLKMADTAREFVYAIKAISWIMGSNGASNAMITMQNFIDDAETAAASALSQKE